MRPLLALALVLLLVAPARAQDAPRRVDVEVEDAPLGDVLCQIARQGGLSLLVDPRIDSTVSADLRGVLCRRAIDGLARVSWCEVTEQAGLLLVTEPARLSARFSDSDPRSILRILAQQAGEAVWVGPDVPRAIDVDFEELPWPAAVARIAEAAGVKLAWEGQVALLGARPTVRPGGAPAPRGHLPRSLDERFPDAARVTVHGDGTLAGLLLELAAAADRSIVLERGVDAPLAATFRDVPWTVALDLTLRLSRCTVEVLEGGVLLVRRPATVSIDAAALPTRAQLAAAGAHASVLVAPDVEGRVAPVCAVDVPADLALRLVAQGAALHAAEVDGVVVVSAAPLGEPPAPEPFVAAADAGRGVSTVAQGEPLGDLLARMARAQGQKAWHDRCLQGAIHARFADTPWPAAVAALARARGARVDVATDGVALRFHPELRAAGAPASGWYALLAEVGDVSAQVGPEVQGDVWCALRGVSARRAFELTAWAHGQRFEVRDGALCVSGAGRARSGGAPAPAAAGPAAPPAAETEPAAPPPSTEELKALEAAVEQDFQDVLRLAAARQVEELVETFARLRDRMGTAHGRAAVERGLTRHGRALADLGEVQLSIKLQVQLATGNALLGDMSLAVKEERFGDVPPLHERLVVLLEAMRAEEREVFHRNAEALYLRGKALADRAEGLARLGQVAPAVTAASLGATEAEHAALVGGNVVRGGQEVPGAPGVVLYEVRRGEVLLTTRGATLSCDLTGWR